MNCVFCTLAKERILMERSTAYLISDAFPVSKGHSLAIPKRHIASWFDATAEERDDLIALLDFRRTELLLFEPDGFNIGINDGVAAGQTVAHLHIHLIPRYRGDSSDPRGGVRWVLPDRARYWE